MWSNEKKESKTYEPHPEGTFMAVCRDIYEVPNKKAGQVNKYGKVEPPTKVRIEFLTDEPIEINGDMLPRLVSTQFNISWNEKSSLREFVSMWNPAMGKLDAVDPDKLIGMGAYLTITQSADQIDKSKIWSNINGIAPPPRGMSVPTIPTDFVRRKDRPADGTATAPAPQKAAPSAPVAEEPNNFPW